MPLARRDGLPEPSGGFTLAVGEETITAEDVVGPVFERLAQVAQRSDFEGFKQVAQPVIEQQLVTKISDALLYSKARKEASEGMDAELDRITAIEVKRFVMNFGGDYAKAEQALKQMGMDWGKFEQYQKRRILSQSYVAEQMPKDNSVTYNEMLEAYNRTKQQLYTTPSSLRFRLIDIEPSKLENIDPNKSRLQQAKELAEGLVKRINQGEDFEQLAVAYSHGHRASAGGLWRKLDPESLAAPYDVLMKYAVGMRPGDIAGPIETANHIFIMQLVEYQSKSVEPFEKVQNEVKARISFERMRTAIDKLNAELVRQASVAQRERFVDFCVREVYKMANR